MSAVPAAPAPAVLPRAPAPRPPGPVLVLGVGNLLLGDEGFGIHALRRFEREPPLAGVRTLVGGMPGVNLVAEFDGVRAVILLDATRDGRPAGTISHLQPRGAEELPRGVGAHDLGLKDLCAALALLGRLPALHLFSVSITSIHHTGPALSREVAAALPPVVWLAHGQAARLALEFTPAAPFHQALRAGGQRMRS